MPSLPRPTPGIPHLDTDPTLPVGATSLAILRGPWAPRRRAAATAVVTDPVPLPPLELTQQSVQNFALRARGLRRGVNSKGQCQF
eukprot:gene12127-biopygen6327